MGVGVECRKVVMGYFLFTCSMFRHFCYKMYRLDTMYKFVSHRLTVGQTDRQTETDGQTVR